MANNKNSFSIHLNLNVRGLPQSATLAINEKSNQLKKEGRKVYKLGLGQSPFPVPKPVVEELKKHAHQKDYLPVKGLMELREAVANYHSRNQNINRTAEDVLIGPGSKELMFLLQFVYYGDLVIPTPSWVSYAPQAHLIGRHVRWLSTKKEDDWRLTPEELLNHCETDPDKPRIVIINYPSNPGGVTYNENELKKLAAIALKHKVILLSDEIYGELHFEGKHVSIAKFYPEGTILSSGLSKWCGAGGWRLGTFTFPASLRWLLDAMAAVASETYTATSAPIQHAAVTAFKGGKEIEDYLKRARKILEKLGKKITRKLIDAGVDVPIPLGGFYLFPDFSPLKEKLALRGIKSSEQLCDKLLEEAGVAVLPGSVFGRPAAELTVRIAYVNFNGVSAMHAADKFNSLSEINDDFILKYCSESLEAIDEIVSWLKK
jgi:aspartate aminotransferase